jgi:outer membrane autotransporter protein
MQIPLAKHPGVSVFAKSLVEEEKSHPYTDSLPRNFCSKPVLMAVLSVMAFTPFSAEGLTQNQIAVLDGLASTCINDTTPPPCLLYNSMVSLSYGGGINNIDTTTLNEVIPDEIAAQGSAAVDFGFRQLGIIHGRIISLRNKKRESLLVGSSSLDLNSKNILRGNSLASLKPGLGGAAGDDNSADQLRDDPLGFFIKGQFNIGEKNKTDNVQGYKNDRQAVTLGIDYTFSDALVLGLSFGYASTHTDFISSNGKMDADSFDFATYGSYFLPKDFYVDWIFSYGRHDFDMKRTVAGTSALSKPTGDQYGFSLGLGNDIAIRSFVINPYARFEYMKTDIAKYSETGGAGLGVDVGKQGLDSVTTTLGSQVSQSISMPWGILSPSIRAEWVHQYKNNTRFIQGRFNTADAGTGSFAIITDSPDRNYFNVGTALAVTLPEGKAAYLRYEYRLGQRDFIDHTVELGARIPF